MVIFNWVLVYSWCIRLTCKSFFFSQPVLNWETITANTRTFSISPCSEITQLLHNSTDVTATLHWLHQFTVKWNDITFNDKPTVVRKAATIMTFHITSCVHAYFTWRKLIMWTSIILTSKRGILYMLSGANALLSTAQQYSVSKWTVYH